MKNSMTVVAVPIFVWMIMGCAAKANTLRAFAAQFKVESTHAVYAIDAMHKKEISPPERTSEENITIFEDNAIQSNKPVTPERIEFWINPYAIKMKPEERVWAEFIANLQLQCITAAGILDDIEKASFTGQKIVKKAAPYIKKATAQFIYFAQSIQQNPPIFLQQRAVLMTKLQIIKDGGNDLEKRKKLRSWREKWFALVGVENETGRKAVEQCLKAALLGKEMQNQIRNYDQLSLNDITEGLIGALGVTGTVAGMDFNHVQGEIDRIATEINNNPAWKEVSKLALKEVNKAIDARNALWRNE